MSASQWSDDRVSTLTTLWLDGLSAAQIAKRLGGVSRNAVIGKAHRLGLARAAASAPAAGPRRPVAPPRPRAPRQAAPRPKAQRPSAPAGRTFEPAPEGPGLVSSLAELRAHACKWPIGDPRAADFSFCGRSTGGAGPYCPGHHAAAHQSRKRPPLARDPMVRRVLAGLAA